MLAGLLMAASVPPWGWWPLGFVGMALWAEVLAEPSRSLRAALSALVAAAWLAPSTVWMIDLSAPGWVCAVAGFAAMHALAGAAVPEDRRRWAAFPAVFTLAEALRWYWPFGGVPLATMAMAQVSGPLAVTARLGGDLLLSGLTAVVGVTLAAVAALRPKPVLIGAALIAVVGFAASQSPRSSAAADRVLQVAAVQGGGPQNTRADICETRGVFERHLQATTAQVTGDVDLIVWPEDVVHLSPPSAAAPARCGDQTTLTATEAGSRLSDLANEKEAVLVAGFFERSPTADRISTTCAPTTPTAAPPTNTTSASSCRLASTSRLDLWWSASATNSLVGMSGVVRPPRPPRWTLRSGRSACPSRGRCSSGTAPEALSATATA